MQRPRLPPKESLSENPWSPFLNRADFEFVYACVHQRFRNHQIEFLLKKELDQVWAGPPKFTFKSFKDVKAAINAAVNCFEKVEYFTLTREERNYVLNQLMSFAV